MLKTLYAYIPYDLLIFFFCFYSLYKNSLPIQQFEPLSIIFTSSLATITADSLLISIFLKNLHLIYCVSIKTRSVVLSLSPTYFYIIHIFLTKIVVALLLFVLLLPVVVVVVVFWPWLLFIVVGANVSLVLHFTFSQFV